jgi:hypothetical protein
MVVMEILKEITPWIVDYRQPNHTYLVNNKNQIIAYAKNHSKDITILKSRINLDKRYRKFIKDNHSVLSKLIIKYKSEDNIITDKDTRIFKVKSNNREYTVLLKDNVYTCNCIGFGYRGKCKHSDAVAKKQQTS